ncbi:MAG: hypothetical protein AB4040_15055 [Synechococcus sp.]
MNARRKQSLRLLMLGASHRMTGASLVVAALWAGFCWATSMPGADAHAPGSRYVNRYHPN